MNIRRVSRIPSQVHDRCGSWLIIPFGLLVGVSLLSLTGLVVTGDFQRNLPAGDPLMRNAREDAAFFLPNDFVLISVDIGDEGLGSTLDRVARLSSSLQKLPGVAKVLSVTTVADISVSKDELSFVKLYRAGAGMTDVDALMRTLEATPVFREYFLSKDARSFSIYVFADRTVSSKQLLPRIDALCAPFPASSVHVLGKRSIEAYIERTVVPDLALLGSLSLAIILIFEIAITRSIAAGIVLCLMTILPSLWTLALFPPLGLRLGVDTLFVPLLVLALSTSYGIQLFRYLALGASPTMGEALDVIAPVILGGGTTTILGFLSLLGSSFREQRILGGMLACGVVLSVLCSLFLLPILLSWVRVPLVRSFRGADIVARVSARREVPFAFVTSLLVLIVGVGFIQTDYRLERALNPRTGLSQRIRYFSQKYGGVNEVELDIDTGREAGLVDPAVFDGIDAVQREIETAPSVSHVASFVPLVKWVNGRLRDERGPPAPGNDTAISECLELLGSSRWGLGSLVDPSYRRAKLVIRFGDLSASPRRAERDFVRLLSRIDTSLRAHVPAATAVVLGSPVIGRRLLLYRIRDQLVGVAAYFTLLFFFTLVFFRSWRWALLAMLPPFCGVALYLGAMGWAQVPLSPVSTLSIAAIMGVGVDDVLCLLLFYRRRRALGRAQEMPGRADRALRETLEMSGSVIIQTTLIIVFALLALLLSRYSWFGQTALLAGGSFLFCTSITLFVVPHFISRFGGSLP